jgi:hypothetical protein
MLSRARRAAPCGRGPSRASVANPCPERRPSKGTLNEDVGSAILDAGGGVIEGTIWNCHARWRASIPTATVGPRQPLSRKGRAEADHEPGRRPTQGPDFRRLV